MVGSVSVTSFYCFIPLEAGRLPALRDAMHDQLQGLEMRAHVVLAPEGVNATACGAPAAVEAFEAWIQQTLGTSEIRFKRSEADRTIFRRIRILIRNEIVTLKRPELVPDAPQHRHVDPATWHALLQSDQPKTLIDTRNRYETALGKFRGAIDPGLQHFSDWSAWLDQAELPKDRPVMIYCTGGIRCEKAILELEARGFEEVIQLRDGILGYLAEFPEAEYEGECFVFDERVALDQHLAPTRTFDRCVDCGQPKRKDTPCTECPTPES